MGVRVLESFRWFQLGEYLQPCLGWGNRKVGPEYRDRLRAHVGSILVGLRNPPVPIHEFGQGVYGD